MFVSGIRLVVACAWWLFVDLVALRWCSLGVGLSVLVCGQCGWRFVSEVVLMTGGLGFGCKVVLVVCNGFGFDWVVGFLEVWYNMYFCGCCGFVV